MKLRFNLAINNLNTNNSSARFNITIIHLQEMLHFTLIRQIFVISFWHDLCFKSDKLELRHHMLIKDINTCFVFFTQQKATVGDFGINSA